MNKQSIMVLALILAACGKGEDVVEWKRVCTESHTETRMIPMYNAALKTTILQPMTTNVCTEYHTVCSHHDTNGEMLCLS